MDAFERVSQDAGLRAVIKTARMWGVSPRRFLGWEPTRSQFMSEGRLITTVETEWDQESRDLALALVMWESDLCPGCQRPMSETTKAENEGRYVATGALRCHACNAHGQAASMWADDPQPRSILIPLEFRGADDDASTANDSRS